MNEVEETLMGINATIGFYKRKIRACNYAIEVLESEKMEILEKYNLEVD